MCLLSISVSFSFSPFYCTSSLANEYEVMASLCSSNKDYCMLQSGLCYTFTHINNPTGLKHGTVCSFSVFTLRALYPDRSVHQVKCLLDLITVQCDPDLPPNRSGLELTTKITLIGWNGPDTSISTFPVVIIINIAFCI